MIPLNVITRGWLLDLPIYSGWILIAESTFPIPIPINDVVGGGGGGFYRNKKQGRKLKAILKLTNGEILEQEVEEADIFINLTNFTSEDMKKQLIDIFIKNVKS